MAVVIGLWGRACGRPMQVLISAKEKPSDRSAFALESVIDCANDKVGNYRPEALREHDDFKRFYPNPPPVNAPPPGKSEEPALPPRLPP